MMSVFNRYIYRSCSVYFNISKNTNKITQIRGLRLSKILRDQKTKDTNKKTPEKEYKKTQGFSWKALVIAVGTGSVFLYYVNHVKNVNKNLEKVKKEVKTLTDQAAVGGPWSLVDFNGELKTSKDYLGKWILIYFGFTNCPDICPDELEKIVQVVDNIDANPNVPNLTPLFITVDPDRDSIGVMKEYLKEFSPKVIGFTGTPEQLDKACKAYRVYYSKGPKDEDGDYIVDHTIITYLVAPDGKFVQYYGKNIQAPQFIKSVEEKMKNYKPHSSNDK